MAQRGITQVDYENAISYKEPPEVITKLEKDQQALVKKLQSAERFPGGQKPSAAAKFPKKEYVMVATADLEALSQIAGFSLAGAAVEEGSEKEED